MGDYEAISSLQGDIKPPPDTQKSPAKQAQSSPAPPPKPQNIDSSSRSESIRGPEGKEVKLCCEKASEYHEWSMSDSTFASLSMAPPADVNHMTELFLKEKDPRKVDLTVGVYRTNEDKPWVLPVVEEAEKQILNSGLKDREYLPALGLEAFTEEAAKLLLGENCKALKEGRVASIQTIAAAGALRLGAELLSRDLSYNQVYVSRPSWANLKMVFSRSGFEHILEYTYWNKEDRNINFAKMCNDLKAAPCKSVIVLNAVAHNPTGCDPTKEQWRKLAKVIKSRLHFVFFECSDQGFATGDPESDAWPVRHFVEEGIELMVAQSFSKNFSLYNERIGNLCVVSHSASFIPTIKSQISLLIRTQYANPPARGARIVATILKDKKLKAEWKECLNVMANRIRETRCELRRQIEGLETPGSWHHITEQIGLFSYIGLSPVQVDHLIVHHKVFCLRDGRVSMCGVNKKNLTYVAHAINHAVLQVVLNSSGSREEERESDSEFEARESMRTPPPRARPTDKDKKKCHIM